MKTLYLDIFSGISGDMFIGALIDLGIDPKRLESEIARLGVPGYHLHVHRGAKASIAGTKFDVHLDHHSHDHEHEQDQASHAAHHHSHHHPHDHHHGEHHHHMEHGPHGGPLANLANAQVELSVFETDVPPRFRIYFSDKNGRPQPPWPAKEIALETLRPGGARQVFRFKKQGDYLEATDELPEPHEFMAVLRVNRGKHSETCQLQFLEEHAHGMAGHNHDHGPNHGAGDPAHGRDFAAISLLIAESDLSDWVKEKATAVFRRIAVAEGKIHGLPPEQVHFHEVGAVDSIVDIVGACVCLELLGKPRVLAGPVIEGTGFIHCAHGRFPIPAPATLAILAARGIPITQCEEPHELVTPTGAALLAELAEEFGPMRQLSGEKIGFGLGTRDNKTRPNVLRAVLGQSSAGDSEHDWQRDTIAVLETNLDDVNAEILGHFVEKTLAAGALDVFHTPIQMKKNRPGALLTVLCAESDADRFTELMLRETSSFGVRRHTAERRKLTREFTTVETPYGAITVKLGRLDGKIIQSAPEYESCRAAAERSGVPLKAIYEAALQAMRART